jgi:O-antigen ligase
VRIAGGLLATWLAVSPFLSTTLADLLRPLTLPISWATRLDIWRAATTDISAHPLLGAGLGSFRALSQPRPTAEGMFQALHPHSASLQIWFELGFVGVALGAASLIALTQAGASALRSDRPACAAATATLLSAGVIANVSYGLWEEWWIATLFIAGGMVAAMRTSS